MLRLTFHRFCPDLSNCVVENLAKMIPVERERAFPPKELHNLVMFIIHNTAVCSREEYFRTFLLPLSWDDQFSKFPLTFVLEKRTLVGRES